MAHYLRTMDYRTILSGKMHFVGPDQLHGFEERLTTDIYPADFAWVPDWDHPDERIDKWYHNMTSGAVAVHLAEPLTGGPEGLGQRRLMTILRATSGVERRPRRESCLSDGGRVRDVDNRVDLEIEKRRPGRRDPSRCSPRYPFRSR